MEKHGLGLGALGLIQETYLLPFIEPDLGCPSIYLSWVGLGLT